MSTKFNQKITLIIFDWEGTLGCGNGELIPGVLATLQILRAHQFDLAIATSMSTHRLKELVVEHQLSDLFVHLQTSEMGYPKPDPQMLEEILTATHHSASETIMVGDSMYDLIMAEAAHVAAIGVLTGSDSEEQLRLGASNVTIIDSVNSLPALLHLS